MGRNIIETHKYEEGTIKLVQDRRDDLANTDRWFVELQMQVRFLDEDSARRFLSLLDKHLMLTVAT